MKNTRPFFTWAICALVTAVMLAGCAAFAFELSDAAFGDNYVTEHHDISDVRVGDILRLDNARTVIVLEVRSRSVIIAEGNFNSSVHWGRELSFSEIEDSIDYIWTRYS